MKNEKIDAGKLLSKILLEETNKEINNEMMKKSRRC